MSSDCFATNYVEDANCQGAWLFTEGTGTTVADSSQNSNTGTFLGTGEPAWDTTDVPFNVSGSAPNSVDFDGSNDYITKTIASGLNVTNAFSFTFWFASDSTSQSETYIFTYAKGSTQYAIIYEYLDNNIEFFAPSRTGDNPRSSSQVSITDTNWHHIAYTYDGTTFNAYKDGSVVDTGTISITTLGVADGGNFWIGKSDIAANYVNGKVTDFAVFNRALTSAEINAIYDYGLTGAATWFPINGIGVGIGVGIFR